MERKVKMDVCKVSDVILGGLLLGESFTLDAFIRTTLNKFPSNILSLRTKGVYKYE